MSSKVGIQARALIGRINRKLAPDQVLKSNRRSATLTDQLGTYFVLDTRHNQIAQRDVNLTRLARKLGAIEPWEELTEP